MAPSSNGFVVDFGIIGVTPIKMYEYLLYWYQINAESFFKAEDIYLYVIIHLSNVYLVLSWECQGMYIYVHPGTWMAFRVCTFMFRLALRGLTLLVPGL